MPPDTTAPTHPNLNLFKLPRELGNHPRCLSSPPFRPHVESWRKGISQQRNDPYEVRNWVQWFWEMQEAYKETWWAQHEGVRILQGYWSIWTDLHFRRIVISRGRLAGDQLSGLRESGWPFYFDPGFAKTNEARTKYFMTKWPITKSLVFPLALKTTLKYSREGEIWGRRKAKIRSALLSLSVEGSQPTTGWQENLAVMLGFLFMKLKNELHKHSK